jgi:hypothetical protein
MRHGLTKNGQKSLAKRNMINFSRCPILRDSSKVRDQVSRLRKAAGKIIVLYIINLDF